MSSVQSITVVLDDGSSFQVDTTANCVLVWSDAGWDVLSEYYDKVKHDPTLAKQVRDRKCPKAKSKQGTATTTAATAVIALKDVTCLPTGWP